MTELFPRQCEKSVTRQFDIKYSSVNWRVLSINNSNIEWNYPLNSFSFTSKLKNIVCPLNFVKLFNISFGDYWYSG